MSVSSSKINYLVWRYLQESGRPLAALAFDKETEISALDAEHSETESGELVRLIIKGLQMENIESQVGQEQAPHVQLVPSGTFGPAFVAAARHGHVAIGTETGSLTGPNFEVELDANTAVTSLAWNNADQLAQGSISGQLRIWDAAGTLLRNLDRHTASISILCWNRSSAFLFSGDISGKVCVWEGHNIVSESTIKGVLTAIWIDTRTLALAAGRNISVHKIDLENPHTEFHGHLAPISCLRFDGSSHLLASGADDGVVNAWHGRSQQPIRSLKGPSSVVALEWVPTQIMQTDNTITSRLLVGYTQSVVFWDVDTSTEIWSIPAPSLVLMAHKDNILAIVSTVLSVYNISAGVPELIGEYTPQQPITDLVWDRKTLWATSNGNSVAFNLAI